MKFTCATPSALVLLKSLQRTANYLLDSKANQILNYSNLIGSSRFKEKNTMDLTHHSTDDSLLFTSTPNSTFLLDFDFPE